MPKCFTNCKNKKMYSGIFTIVSGGGGGGSDLSEDVEFQDVTEKENQF